MLVWLPLITVAMHNKLQYIEDDAAISPPHPVQKGHSQPQEEYLTGKACFYRAVDISSYLLQTICDVKYILA
eukprot:scaffold36205_cov67-Attheya_sp.AAC.1